MRDSLRRRETSIGQKKKNRGKRVKTSKYSVTLWASLPLSSVSPFFPYTHGLHQKRLWKIFPRVLLFSVTLYRLFRQQQTDNLDYFSWFSILGAHRRAREVELITAKSKPWGLRHSEEKRRNCLPQRRFHTRQELLCHVGPVSQWTMLFHCNF